ncbi:4-hydroxyacetophenone monooxygenase [Nakamurella sp. UYEF19]|uniref:flavin-containing monooxygenase n=1 Tax=Nakamurella sp. UYEF19 TaxID=1756392 RepID=UPI0033981F9B
MTAPGPAAVPTPPAVAQIDAERLAAALRSANVPTLVPVLFQLTGDERWLGAPYAPTAGRGMDDNTRGGLDEDIQAEIRSATLVAVLQWAAGRAAAVPAPRGGRLVELASVAVGEHVPPEFEPMVADMLGLEADPDDQPIPGAERFDVVVIGAGVSGMTAAIRLRATGASVTVLEKNADVGGTWLENAYPGAGVDTPSYLYSLSFFDHDWSTHFGKRDEVQSYLREVADHFALRDLIRFGVEVEAADWDDATQRWTIVTSAGDRLEANAVVSAVGQLNRPKIPDLSGLEDFHGRIFHSAQWPADLDVTGKRVAIVGTGASAMQIVPAIVDKVQHLTVFQRSPQWIAPNDDYFRAVGDDVHHLMATVPFYREWYRVRLAWTFNDKVHPSLQVDPDWPEPTRSVNAINDGHRRFFTRYLLDQLEGRPDLQEQALPDYPPFGKRMLLDNGWFAALRQPQVELVTSAVAALEPGGVRAGSGEFSEADIVVLCTGFEARRFLYPMHIRGRSGRTLEEQWGPEDATAYLGITVPDFPNLFLLLGPNTALGHGGSIITITEFQVDYVVSLVRQMLEHGVGSLECPAPLAVQYNERVDRAHASMLWTHPGMSNWYRNSAGRVVSTLPWRIVDYRAMTRDPELATFLTRPAVSERARSGVL